MVVDIATASASASAENEPCQFCRPRPLDQSKLWQLNNEYTLDEADHAVLEPRCFEDGTRGLQSQHTTEQGNPTEDFCGSKNHASKIIELEMSSILFESHMNEKTPFQLFRMSQWLQAWGVNSAKSYRI